MPPNVLLHLRSSSAPANLSAGALRRPATQSRLSQVSAPRLPTSPAADPVPVPHDRDPRHVAAWLEDRHVRTQGDMREAFGSTPEVPRQKRFIVSTVTSAEAVFLADHLDVPRANVISINTRRWPDTSTRARIRKTLAPFLDQAQFDNGALTFLGHMHNLFEGNQRLPSRYHAFAKLPAGDLFELFQDAKPKHLNMFSCFSENYSTQLNRFFAWHGAAIKQRAFFRSEVSPYPSHATKNHPIRFFYAGPEVGQRAPILGMQLHDPVLSANHMGALVGLPARVLPPSHDAKDSDDQVCS